MERQTNTQYVASISYGKDSLAMLEAISTLDYPLDRIVTAQVWATDDIPADLPEMYEWKCKADVAIKARWGIEVEHLTATKNGEKWTYEKQFYSTRQGNHKWRKTPASGGGVILSGSLSRAQLGATADSSGVLYGFPIVRGAWCNSKLKMAPMQVFLRAPARGA